MPAINMQHKRQLLATTHTHTAEDTSHAPNTYKTAFVCRYVCTCACMYASQQIDAPPPMTTLGQWSNKVLLCCCAVVLLRIGVPHE